MVCLFLCMEITVVEVEVIYLFIFFNYKNETIFRNLSAVDGAFSSLFLFFSLVYNCLGFNRK